MYWSKCLQYYLSCYLYIFDCIIFLVLSILLSAISSKLLLPFRLHYLPCINHSDNSNIFQVIIIVSAVLSFLCWSRRRLQCLAYIYWWQRCLHYHVYIAASYPKNIVWKLHICEHYASRHQGQVTAQRASSGLARASAGLCSRHTIRALPPAALLQARAFATDLEKFFRFYNTSREYCTSGGGSRRNNYGSKWWC